MTDIKEAIYDRMTTDVELMTLLAGGVYRGAEIAPSMPPPRPFDAVGRVQPSALVRNETSTAVGPRRRFDRQFAVIFFYDHAGYEVINEALARARAILHEQRVGDGAYQLWHVDTVRDQYDDAILAYMHRSRYELSRRG